LTSRSQSFQQLESMWRTLLVLVGVAVLLVAGVAASAVAMAVAIAAKAVVLAAVVTVVAVVQLGSHVKQGEWCTLLRWLTENAFMGTTRMLSRLPRSA
jgi:hypothetical protein